MRVLVTGASGFVGRAVVARLAADGREVIAASRSPFASVPPGVAHCRMNTLGSIADPLTEYCPADVVVHAAARVHVMHDSADDPLAMFREVNVEGTLAIARQTRLAGARRLVYLSSIKVLGEESQLGQPLDANSPPAPVDPYGVSKLRGGTSVGTILRQ